MVVRSGSQDKEEEEEVEYVDEEEDSEELEEKKAKGKSLQSTALLKINANKKKLGNRRVFKQFAEGEEKIEWQKVMSTEIAVGEINPVYLASYSFNSANFLQIHMKVEIYYSITGKNSTERG